MPIDYEIARSRMVKEQLIKKYGEVYFKSTEENEPMGSSATLIMGETLKTLGSAKPVQVPEIFHRINVYESVKEGHNYIISADPSGDGVDNFGLHVIDVTKFPFIKT